MPTTLYFDRVVDHPEGVSWLKTGTPISLWGFPASVPFDTEIGAMVETECWPDLVAARIGNFFNSPESGMRHLRAVARDWFTPRFPAVIQSFYHSGTAARRSHPLFLDGDGFLCSSYSDSLVATIMLCIPEQRDRNGRVTRNFDHFSKSLRLEDWLPYLQPKQGYAFSSDVIRSKTGFENGEIVISELVRYCRDKKMEDLDPRVVELIQRGRENRLADFSYHTRQAVPQPATPRPPADEDIAMIRTTAGPSATEYPEYADFEPVLTAITPPASIQPLPRSYVNALQRLEFTTAGYPVSSGDSVAGEVSLPPGFVLHDSESTLPTTNESTLS